MQDRTDVLMGADGPVTLRGHCIARSQPCIRCGHDLRGVTADGRCPECGHAVFLTLQAAIDPVAHRLPTIHRPELVGWGLVTAVAGMLIFETLGLIWLGWELLARATSSVSLDVPSQSIWLAQGIELTVAGLAAGALIWPRSTGEGGSPRRVVIRLAAGMVVAGIAALVATTMDVRVFSELLAGFIATVGLVWALLGLRGVVLEAGRRSRTFRLAGLRRQRISTLVAALAWKAVGIVLIFATVTWGVASLAVIGAVLLVMASCFVVVGLAYLLVNVWWIKSSLTQPPPRLTDLLEDA